MARISTTTGSFSSDVPVKLLDASSSRQYASIGNNSATTIFLYFSNEVLQVVGDGSGTIATSTIDTLDGIPVKAGETYEILPENLITDWIYASSTLSDLQINITYKQ